MGLFLLLTGFSFWIPASTTVLPDGTIETAPHGADARTACVALGIYLFGIVYSPGEGPVPFTYSAEAYPLYVRAYGMALATATTWFFNFTLAITWPSLVRSFTPQGAFGWYAAWNMVGFVLIFLFLRETKGKTLEELDRVFEVPMGVFARGAVGEVVGLAGRVLGVKLGKQKEGEGEKRDGDGDGDEEVVTPRVLESNADG